MFSFHVCYSKNTINCPLRGKKYTTYFTLWFQIEEELVRILRYERELSMTVDGLINTYKDQYEKLKGFLSQRFSLRRDEITGTNKRGLYDILSWVHMYLTATIKLSDYQ